MNGFFGKYLLVDLSNGNLVDYEIPREWIRKHLGGRGIGARIMLKELEGDEDPLGEENLLIFGTGPFQGTGIAGAGRHLVMSKSPKTGSIGGSYSGGFFAHELGTSGFDGIIVRGKAKTPKYISVIKGKARIHDARELWGLDTAKTESKLRKIHGDIKAVTIGLAGENLVKFSCVMTDHTRAAGRPGLGMVMGSKKLKAIIVKGGVEKPIYDKDSLRKARTEFAKELMKDPSTQRVGKYGTPGGLEPLNELGILPTKYFQEGYFEKAKKIGLEEYENILVDRDTCPGCPIRCKRKVSTSFNNKKVDKTFGGPEYETLAAFGSLCLNENLHSIALANQLCNMYGLDTISTGNIIAFMMEACERGLFEGDLKWGDSASMVELVEKIARREGIGDLLAEGLDHIAREVGADFAMEIKGQEIPLHDPRGKKGLALSYATTPRGVNHLEGLHDTLFEMEDPTPELGIYEQMDRLDWKGKVKAWKIYEDLRSFTNSLIMCVIPTKSVGDYYNYPQIRNMLNLITNLNIGVEEMIKIGERNYNLLKIFASREGFTREDDDLPPRFKEPLPNGNTAGESIPDEILQEKINEYYELRGYDRYGPTDEKLVELEMDEFKGTISRASN